ncbi:hypothetical protein [Aeromonas salmonicida]|uniref:hypothetical protein n=1 Tax=Aeromonas salmonicida TaxID=645 RepID=UPI000F797596|nr:hypothetical protein [Aeromonas salmonicida]RSM24965.1 hypothetical protein C5B77_19410 [Aeromonas salmonicida]
MNFQERYGIKPVSKKMQDGEEIFIKQLSYKAAVSVACEYSVARKSVLTLVYGLCDETGKNVFTEDSIEWIEENLSFNTIQEIASYVAEISTRDIVKKQDA